MTSELLDHAARLLEHERTRCMPAAALHTRAARDTGIALGLDAFVHALRRRPERFTLVPAAALLDDGLCWGPGDRAEYGAALDQAACGGPLVMLAAAAQGTAEAGVPATAAEAPVSADVLTDVHDALALVLQQAGADESLRGAAWAAVQEMEVVRRGLLGR